MEEQRIAIVTGATRGIGRATAELLALGGMSIVLAARDEAALKEMAEQFERQGKTALPVPTDVRRHEDCARLVAKAVERFGRVDALVNNAGIGIFAPIADLGENELREVIETNLFSLFFLCKAAIPHMRSQPTGGHIVNVASLASKNTFKGGGAYCASKFGVRAMTECLMLEERHNNIRVTAILPGSVDTGFGGEAPAPWKIPPGDVARVIADVINATPGSLQSVVEIRPLMPPGK